MRDNLKNTDRKDYIFYLHMQMIVDGLNDQGIPCSFHSKEDEPGLLDISFFRGQKEFRKELLYIAEAKELSEIEGEIEGQLPEDLSALLVIGELETSCIPDTCSLILLPEKRDLFWVYEVVRQVFHRARTWDSRMQNVINNHGSLNDLCEAAEEYFRNPLFIHNPNFYILACKTHYDSMDPWQRDERTGLNMLSTDLINGFKMDPEYLATMNKHGSQIFPIDSTGYRVMYVNLWDDFGRYEGRICIDELLTAFQPGQMPALEHFGRMTMVLLQQRNFQSSLAEKPFSRMILDMIRGESVRRDYLEGILDSQGWKIHDCYRLFKMELNWRDQETSSIINTCNYIEGTINECRAFSEENSIFVILNITKSLKKEDEIMQILVQIVREMILMTGISNDFDDFTNLAYYYQQASLALSYGMKKNPTIWIHRFDQYVMDYCCDMVCRELPSEFICAPEVMKLRQHDQEKHTELYETLKTYLSCMLNAEQTARTLFIHRSTLFYRLKKIREVSGLDLNEPENLFYIQFSIRLIEQGV